MSFLRTKTVSSHRPQQLLLPAQDRTHEPLYTTNSLSLASRSQRSFLYYESVCVWSEASGTGPSTRVGDSLIIPHKDYCSWDFWKPDFSGNWHLFPGIGRMTSGDSRNHNSCHRDDFDLLIPFQFSRIVLKVNCLSVSLPVRTSMICFPSKYETENRK